MKTEEILEILESVDFKRLKVVEIRRSDGTAYIGFPPSKDGWVYYPRDPILIDKFWLYPDGWEDLRTGYPWDDPIRVDSKSVRAVYVEEIGDEYTLPNPTSAKDGLIVRIYLK